MQLRFISFLLLLVTGLAVATDVEELKIETTYAPPECALKAQSGDNLKVHYVSWQLDVSINWALTLHSDGQAVLRRQCL